MLTYAFVPFIFSLILFLSFAYPVADTIASSLQESFVHIESTKTTYDNGIPHTENTNTTYSGSDSIVNFILTSTLFAWVLSFLSIFVFIILFFIIAIFSAILVIGFLTPAIMRELQRRHYPELTLDGHGNVLTTLLHSLKYIAVTFILLIVLIPLYFVPLLNIVAINLPFYYLFHKFYLLDVGTTALLKEEYKQMIYFNGNKLRFTTLILYLIAMIPFAALITPVFNVIVLSHTVFRNKQELLKRSSDQLADSPLLDKSRG
ncbi:MAG: EI24 domain-containing protein [Thiovulaceae bacterium]|nr:EI24 domain-containing protein [Sulfurimonadaceae bacterium]